MSTFKTYPKNLASKITKEAKEQLKVINNKVKKGETKYTDTDSALL